MYGHTHGPSLSVPGMESYLFSGVYGHTHGSSLSVLSVESYLFSGVYTVSWQSPVLQGGNPMMLMDSPDHCHFMGSVPWGSPVSGWKLWRYGSWSAAFCELHHRAM